MNAPTSLPLTLGLAPYAGPWTFEQAAHLMRRTTYGPVLAHIKWAVDQGLSATVDKLFEELPQPDLPVNAFYTGDPGVPVGAPWIDATYDNTILNDQASYRFRSLTSWTYGLIWQEGISIREKLTLFWHNHFPVNAVEDPKFLLRYGALLRSYAWGNFRELTKEITVDPSMLRYLNGFQNKKEAPNENYARELLELFTIGKGPQTGPGDYTNYNEQDVQAFARILSGWRDFGLTVESIDGSFGSYFTADRHDDGTKVLSSHFNSEVVTNMGDQEYLHLIDIIFQQDEVARFICRKLYRWFVFYQIDEEVETNVIAPMAQIMLDNDFEIKQALQALLQSEHFFDTAFTGVLIKNPIDFLMSILKTFEVETSTPLSQQYDSWYRIWGFARQEQLSYFEVPEVAGWQAYYREPLYYRNWLNASTLPLRMTHADVFCSTGYFPFQANGQIMRVEVLKFLDTLDNPDDPNAVVDECTRLLFPKPISADRKAALKEILLPGLPDFEWTVEYLAYAANPGNPAVANPIDAKLRALIRAMVSMPDFFLS
ncbi:MAG: DUF1800 domain-containing protein [Saprospirales bacterium]|nr:DUF1800 domain-containing protein [Saprospirales bacterium]